MYDELRNRHLPIKRIISGTMRLPCWLNTMIFFFQILQFCHVWVKFISLLLLEQFIYDLPTRLEKCIKSEAYAEAVKFYTGAMPIFKVYLLIPYNGPELYVLPIFSGYISL